MTDRTISPPGSPLRRRMTADMTVRGFTLSTQRGYLRAVRDFTAFLGRPPDRSDAEDLRRYRLYMRSNGASATSMNAGVSAVRFFFGVTLGPGRCERGHDHRARAAQAAGGAQPRGGNASLGRGAWASSTGRRCRPPMGRACAPRRWSPSGSPTSTADAWSSGWNKVRAARTATPCCRKPLLDLLCGLGGWRRAGAA